MSQSILFKSQVISDLHHKPTKTKHSFPAPDVNKNLLSSLLLPKGIVKLVCSFPDSVYVKKFWWLLLFRFLKLKAMAPLTIDLLVPLWICIYLKAKQNQNQKTWVHIRITWKAWKEFDNWMPLPEFLIPYVLYFPVPCSDAAAPGITIWEPLSNRKYGDSTVTSFSQKWIWDQTQPNDTWEEIR